MRLLSVILACVLLSGCSRPSGIDSRLAEAEQRIESAPDSALAILEDAVRAGTTYLTDEQKAKVSLLSAKTKLHLGKSFLTDENFDDAIRFYESTRDTSALLDFYQLAAIRMRWQGKQDSSASFLKKAIGIASSYSAPTRSELFIGLSNLYAMPSMKKDYPAAINYARQALDAAVSDEERARALHDLGLFYSFCNQNDSATIFIEESLRRITADSPSYTTYALNYANTPEADFQRSIAYLGGIKTESLGKYITLGFLYLNHSIPDSALHYANKARSMYEDSPSRYSINTYNNLRLLERCIEMRNTGYVLPYEGTVTNDSISEVMVTQRKISEEQKDHNNMLQLRLLESKTQRQQMWNLALGVLLLLMGGFGITLWLAKRKYMRIKRQLDEVKVEQIVSEANEEENRPKTSADLIRNRLSICVEQFRITKLQSDIDRMELQYRNAGNFPAIKVRESVQKGLIACFADFIVDLKMTGAKLNLDDIVCCIMSCLKETNTATAACLGTTDTAVRTRKSRLRSKLPPYIVELLGL